jgi:hypothetical protein
MGEGERGEPEPCGFGRKKWVHEKSPHGAGEVDFAF